MDTADVNTVYEPARAAILLHPLRLRILELARAPASASELAAQLGLPRQKVNYHVRQLAQAKFLRRAGQSRKRNLIEQRYVASARAYVLAPDLLGPISVHGQAAEPVFSAARLVSLAARAQADVGRAVEHASSRGLRIATIAMSADVRFESAEQRRAFADALQAAVTDVISRFSSPTDIPGAGRPFRMLVACYPIP
jgi:DNA-binding transcriptional ArsR family regulator